MNSTKKFYKKIDLLRLLACIAILLYHLGLLKGGYLAVCTFFVLSGYLSCVSAFKKEKFSILEYYKNRLKKIYLPLIIVVFTTILATSFLKELNWLNLKPESTSVLLGYNNFWQLSANLDYFSRHIDSPFMHLWYISILLQFELVFPFIYIGLRKVGDKIHKMLPCLLTILLSIAGAIYFYWIGTNENVMVTYYGTIPRLFSLLFGLFLGFVHSYYGPLIPKTLQKSIPKNVIFAFYLVAQIALFVLVDASSPYFLASMICTTIMTVRLIDYGTIDSDEKKNLPSTVVNFFSGMSYEIYLIQYPVIFLFQYICLAETVRLPIVIFAILALSYILNLSLKFDNPNAKKRGFSFLIFLVLVKLSLLGAYQYYLAEDHTEEMNRLEEQLATNERLLAEKQEAYASRMEKEEKEWLSNLESMSMSEEQLSEAVSNLRVVGVGDSVMLGAIDDLYTTFKNGYFDAKISRTAWVVKGILEDLSSKNLLGEPIVLNLGANGDCSESCKIEIMKKCEDRQVFWLNVTNDEDVHINASLASFAEKYPNLHIIDWNAISAGHPEYFFADGIHLTGKGRVAYTQAIYDAIYQVYKEQSEVAKNEMIKNHEDEQKKKLTIYGNGLIVNAFDEIHRHFEDAAFATDKNYTFDTLYEELSTAIKDDTLTNRVVLAFDETSKINIDQYRELTKLLENREVYIVNTTKNLSEGLAELKSDSLSIIDFQSELASHEEYLLADKIHLSAEGNEALSILLKEALTPKEN